MKPLKKKEQFILKRAEGLSYAKIATELHISKSTCSKWESELQNNIAVSKEDRLQQLYSLYRIGREAYIEKLGETLKGIDKALSEKDLRELPADKLLKLKLEYEEKIQELYTSGESSCFTTFSTEEILNEAASIYDRIKTGQISTAQAKSELASLESIKKAACAYSASDYFDNTEININNY